MDHLIGRLGASGPEARDSLRIVAYFDTLIARGAGVDGLLRGAAVLAGCVAGARVAGRERRRDPEGSEPPPGSAPRDAPTLSGSDWQVWLERDGPASTSEETILERVAFGVELLQTQRRVSGFEVVIDPVRPLGERAAALARFRLDPHTPLRIHASPSTTPTPEAPSAIVPTRYGLLRATLDRTGELDARGAGRSGIGPWTRADAAPDSWEGAFVALRLTDAQDPVVDANDLGPLLTLLRQHDPQGEPHPDVQALAQLDDRSMEALRVVVEAESIRAAAARLGMHHSSVQARHDTFVHFLGYDPRSPLGRGRYIAAALLLRLTDPA